MVRTSYADLTIAIIENSTCLKEFVTAETDWSASDTARLMSALENGPSLQVYEHLHLNHLNFTEDDTCIALAELLAAATNLTKLMIDPGKCIGRKFTISVTNASEMGEPGLVKITDKNTKLVYTCETKRTKRLAINEK